MARGTLTETHPLFQYVETITRLHVVPCNQCGSQDVLPFLPSNGLGLVQCANCKLVFVGSRPEARDLYALYDESYFQNDESGIVGYSHYLKDEANIRKTFARRLRTLEQFAQPGKLLDVGCAAGFFLDEAHKHGWQVQGVDVSNFVVQYARERFGYDVRQGSLLDQDFSTGDYDLVTMWDVIEHVPDPKAYIEQIAALLKPGGILALATPDIDSIPARLTGSRWVGYKLSEEHVYYFSQHTLSQMLESAGFEIVRVNHVGKYVTLRLFLDRLSMYSSLLANLLTQAERAFSLSEWSLLVNPLDIISITARKR